MNCRGLSDHNKRRDVIHFVRNLNYNIIFLQETHMTTSAIPYFNCLWKGKCYHSCCTSRSRGVCILFNKDIQHNVIKEISSNCGNYVFVICKINTEVFAFANIYGPNVDQPNYFKDVFTHLQNVDVDHVIIGGDMNFIINPEVDCFNYARENNINARKTFLQMADENNLIDIWREMNPSERKYTWTRTNPYKCGRLDMFFISKHLLNKVSEVNNLSGYRTDHSAITLTFEIKQQARGSGLWMFNISHLQSEEYINRIKSCISNAIKQYAVPVYQEHMYIYKS